MWVLLLTLQTNTTDTPFGHSAAYMRGFSGWSNHGLVGEVLDRLVERGFAACVDYKPKHGRTFRVYRAEVP